MAPTVARVFNPCSRRPNDRDPDPSRPMGHSHDCSCRRFPRRAFLADLGMGFTGLALAAMLRRDGVARAADDSPTAPDAAYTPPDGRPDFAPKAKRVIWLFMVGGVSHMESF